MPGAAARGEGHEMHQLISGRAWGDDDPNAERRLLFGVEYGDGRTVTTTTSPSLPGPGIEDDQPVLNPNSGGGGDLAYDQRFWLSPVPPAGSVPFVCAWPAFGIPETVRPLEDLDLTTASRSVVVLWAAARSPAQAEPLPPPVPDGGWFFHAIGDSQQDSTG
jgi:hypothetical protein